MIADVKPARVEPDHWAQRSRQAPLQIFRGFLVGNHRCRYDD